MVTNTATVNYKNQKKIFKNYSNLEAEPYIGIYGRMFQHCTRMASVKTKNKYLCSRNFTTAEICSFKLLIFLVSSLYCRLSRKFKSPKPFFKYLEEKTGRSNKK